MSFNLYFAGARNGTDETILKIQGNRLLSQLNDRKGLEFWIEYKKEHDFKLFVDSGAYSAHTKGAELDVDEYISYINKNEGIFDVVAQVDKIPGEFKKHKTLEQLKSAPEESWQNYLYMRERVIDADKLLPIFHQGEDFKHLQRMLEAKFDGKHIPYIGISPANDLLTSHKAKWLETVFRIIRDSSNPQVKTHAFGMTTKNLLEKYPFYSADSTTWLMQGIFGSIQTPVGNFLVSDRQKDKPDYYLNQPKPVLDKLYKLVEERGFNMKDLEEGLPYRAGWNAIDWKIWADNYKYKGTNKYQKRLF